MSTIAILGTMDTKGEEHAFVAGLIRQRGHQTLIIDVGTLESPQLKPDIAREEVARAAGADLAALVVRRDRGEAVHPPCPRVRRWFCRGCWRKRKSTVLFRSAAAAGTSICTAGMRALPIGFPKLMVSTLASGNHRSIRRREGHRNDAQHR